MRILKLLIENGASVSFKPLEGGIALTYADSYRTEEISEFLIKSGANINSTCNNLKTCSDA